MARALDVSRGWVGRVKEARPSCVGNSSHHGRLAEAVLENGRLVAAAGQHSHATLATGWRVHRPDRVVTHTAVAGDIPHRAELAKAPIGLTAPNSRAGAPALHGALGHRGAMAHDFVGHHHTVALVKRCDW